MPSTTQKDSCVFSYMKTKLPKTKHKDTDNRNRLFRTRKGNWGKKGDPG